MKIIKRIFILLFVIFLVLSIFEIYKNITLNKEINNNKKVVSKLKKDLMNKKNIIQDAKDLINEDIELILDMPEFGITEYVVKARDNNYYLRRNLKKVYSEAGTLFMDYRSNINSKQINIYGHSAVLFETTFNKLFKYLDYNFFINSKSIYLIDDQVKNEYEIIGLYKTKDDITHTKVGDNRYERFKKMLDLSIHKKNTTINEDDEFLVLQTCMTGKEKSKVLVILYKKIKK